MRFFQFSEYQNLLYNALTLGCAYGAIIAVHYISAHAYTWYCAPTGWYGAVISPFITSAPHCRALRWTIQHFASTIDNTWTILGTWLGSVMIANRIR